MSYINHYTKFTTIKILCFNLKHSCLNHKPLAICEPFTLLIVLPFLRTYNWHHTAGSLFKPTSFTQKQMVKVYPHLPWLNIPFTVITEKIPFYRCASVYLYVNIRNKQSLTCLFINKATSLLLVALIISKTAKNMCRVLCGNKFSNHLCKYLEAQLLKYG